MPLANASVNLAGQPSKVTGTVARVFAWLTLIFGTLISTGVAAACNAISQPGALAPYIIGIPMVVLAWVVSYALFRGGRQLKQSGADHAKATRQQAVYALANVRGGVVTPAELAQSIGTSVDEADAILTSLAKEQPDHVDIDVDDNGNLQYRFSAAHWQALAARAAPGAPYSHANARVAEPAPIAAEAAGGEAGADLLDAEEELAAPERARARAR